jgi:hypothetical protein
MVRRSEPCLPSSVARSNERFKRSRSGSGGSSCSSLTSPSSQPPSVPGSAAPATRRSPASRAPTPAGSGRRAAPHRGRDRQPPATLPEDRCERSRTRARGDLPRASSAGACAATRRPSEPRLRPDAVGEHQRQIVPALRGQLRRSSGHAPILDEGEDARADCAPFARRLVCMVALRGRS